MKRLTALFLTGILLFSVTACSSQQNEQSASFYYCRKDYRYHQEDSVIAPEPRNISEQSNTIHHLMALYFIGPQSDELELPFPPEVKLLLAEKKAHNVYITLSGGKRILDTYQYSLGCACLAMTAFGLTGCSTVFIQCGENVTALTPDDLLLYDNTYTVPTTED